MLSTVPWYRGWKSREDRIRERALQERYGYEATSAAMKLVVNSAYGYLTAGGLTRFADVHAANEVTRRGRETLELMCRELAGHGVTLLEADTDGVYFAVPEGWTEADERHVVAEVAAMLPPRAHRNSKAGTPRCCRTSRKTTRCCDTTARSFCTASHSVRAGQSLSAKHFSGKRARICW
jgi:hypothetical protein